MLHFERALDNEKNYLCFLLTTFPGLHGAAANSASTASASAQQKASAAAAAPQVPKVSGVTVTVSTGKKVLRTWENATRNNVKEILECCKKQQEKVCFIEFLRSFPFVRSKVHTYPIVTDLEDGENKILDDELPA